MNGLLHASGESDANQRTMSSSYPFPVEDLRERLEQALAEYDTPSDAIADTFTKIVEQHPNENITRLWLEGIYQNYQELNDTTSNLQAWRNTGGNAFEKFVVNYYNARLPKYLELRHVSENPEIQKQLKQIAHRSSKDIEGQHFGDAALIGTYNGDDYLFGVVQTMTSFGGRLREEEWKGEVAQEFGMFAPLVTLDASSNTDQNIDGEVGDYGNRNVPGRIVEQNGSFENMYSFNSNTDQTPEEIVEENRIWNVGTVDFDAFINDAIEAWTGFIQPRKQVEAFNISD